MTTQFNPAQTSYLGGINNTFLGMGRNRIINGGFDIDQANGGSSISITSATQRYGPDMWLAEGQSADGVFSFGRLDNPGIGGFQKGLRITVTTPDASVGASQIYGFQTRLEGFYTKDFQFGTASAKTLTLSFWVRGSVTGTYGLGILNGASNRSYVANYTINTASTWEYKTITFVGDTSGTWGGFSAVDMYIEFDLGSGSNFENAAGSWVGSGKWRTSGNIRLINTNAATLDFTGVQLEIGTSATPFEFRPYPIELIMCQRYYETSYDRDEAPGSSSASSSRIFYGGTETSGSISAYIAFKVNKRAAPTITAYRGSGASGIWDYHRNGATGTFSAVGGRIGTWGCNIGGTGTGADWTVVNIDGHWVADSRL